jgi:putative nucleotidyltransferase with HDIG domain
MMTAVDRATVIDLMTRQVTNENLRHHMLATEAIMRALAVRLGDDPDEWGLAGLGHDIDAEQTAEDFRRHGVLGAETLATAGASPKVTHAVAAHNPATGTVAEATIDVALVAADQLSGLITAATLVRPDRAMGGVAVKSLRKRFRETAFARGVDRDSIARCAELELEMDEFLAIGLAAVQGIAADLGLAG